jgi:hypothetical protein
VRISARPLAASLELRPVSLAGLGQLARAWELRWHIAIALILVVAILLRFVRLGSVPLPLSDEVFAGADAHSLLLTGYHVDGPRGGLLAYIVAAIDGRAIAWLIHGTSLVDLRVISGVFGVATIALMIPLGVELGDITLGVLAAGALAVMPWHIYFSRIFYPASEYAFLTFLALLLELRALRRNSLGAAISSATAAVAALYIYPVSIVATPLLAGAALLVRREQLMSFGLKRSVPVAVTAGVLLIPYLIDHLSASDSNVGGQNSVIVNAMIWNHGLGPGDLAYGVFLRWLSFLSVPFTIVSGDPIVRWSIQVMGSVGWALGPVGWVGIIIALSRRTTTDLTLLMWLALYPVADAITYYNAAPNSVRGFTGSIVWSLFDATALIALARWSSKRRFRRSARNRTRVKVALTTLLTAATAAQIVGFTLIYFGSYKDAYAYAFETGYPRIYTILKERNLEAVPITLHAGYRRDSMLQFFSDYHLRSSEQVLACYDLPYNALHFTPLPRIFVVREDPDVQQDPECIHQGLILRDEAALRDVVSQPGEPRRIVDVLATFPDDISQRYNTALIYVHY